MANNDKTYLLHRRTQNEKSAPTSQMGNKLLADHFLKFLKTETDQKSKNKNKTKIKHTNCLFFSPVSLFLLFVCLFLFSISVLILPYVNTSTLTYAQNQQLIPSFLFAGILFTQYRQHCTIWMK